nr:orotidine-5'-phosphate decarboxylase [Caldalkalibacillus salinus]
MNATNDPSIMIALDFQDADQAISFVHFIDNNHTFSKPWFKVGMELYYAAGPTIIAKIKEKGFPIFLDLKLHDIPNTVKGAARSITSLGVDMFNVHCSGGSAMLEAAREGIAEATSAHSSQHSPLLIGVTQLTSTSEVVLREEIGIPLTIEEAVTHYATLAHQHGLDGVVSSPLEVQSIKAACGPSFITVTPGIRPASVSRGDQVRVTTPRQAKTLGTDFMVIGRAVTQATDPIKALEDIYAEIV